MRFPSPLRRLGLVLSLLGLTPGCELLHTEYSHDEAMEDEDEDEVVCASARYLTAGEQGLLHFAYDYGAIVCAFGCGADEPIAERSTVQIDAFAPSGVELPPVHAVSDAPEVATFEILHDGDVEIQAHAPGSVRLELRDADDELVEAVGFEVRPVASIELYDSEPSPLTIMVGGSDTIHLDLRDEDGCHLVGIGGLDYTMTGTIEGDDSFIVLSTVVGWFLEPWTGSPVDELFGVLAQSVGEASVVARAPSGSELVLPVSVVDASAVAELGLSEPELPWAAGSDEEIYAWAADAEGTLIEDPDCEWSIDPADGPVVLDDRRSYVSLYSEVPARATVRCTLGSQSEAVSVVFQ
ncbi:MAG: hypothetical protein H6712_28145 [Myxococcales bacterium]|nr:hypothetical protein [Myxococcales bacterium]MCB9717753.1 hypothetical protein [Myxococcales bacterium]